MMTKKFLAAAFALGAFTFTPNFYNSPMIQVAHAEIKTYTGTGEYLMSDGETQDFAKEGAKMHAARDAQEQAGVFVSSNTKVKNHMVTSDEVETFTASIVKIIGEPKFEPVLIPGNDGKTYIKFIATVTVAVDTDDLNAQIDKWLNRDSQDRSNIVAQNKSLQEIIDNQAKQIARLENIIANANSAQDSANIQAELKQIDNDALYAKKIEDANKLYDNKDYSAAINLYVEASQLKPNHFVAYNNCGNAYANLNRHAEALSAYNKTIELNPDFELAYYNRGLTYANLNQYEKAISDFTKAVQLNPNDAKAYYSRGLANDYLSRYESAVSDYSRAVEINPRFAEAYNNRGLIYKMFRHYNAAISDFNKVIELNPNDSKAYHNRGFCYYLRGENEKANADFAKVKENTWKG